MNKELVIERVRWGIAGTGMIAAEMARTLAGVEGAELAAVGSRTANRAAAFADEHGVDRAHASYRALVSDPNVDIVYVATPHSHHVEHTLMALRRGKHVLCEKAFARSAHEARTMVAAAREHDRFLMEGMWTWFNPAVVEVRDRIGAGEIGEVRALRADFGFVVDATHQGRLVDAALAGGSLLDMGIYPVALARLLLGATVEVQAIGHLGPTGVDTNLAVLLGHDGGAVTIFHTSLQAQTSLTAEITGTAGRVVLDAPFWAPAGYALHRGGEVQRHGVPHRGLAHEVEHVHSRVAGGHRESDVLPLETSIAMMETLDAIRDRIGLRYPGEGAADAASKRVRA